MRSVVSSWRVALPSLPWTARAQASSRTCTSAEVAKEFYTELAACDMHNDCVALGVRTADRLAESNMPADELEDAYLAIDAAVAERVAAIKAGRGQRSNGAAAQ